MKIVGHCIVKNEEKFIWYAINSVIDFLDEIYIWDTGSSDETCKIIESINNPKIHFEKKGMCTPLELSNYRNEMIKKTNADWIFILDGDEVWHKDAIEEIVDLINKNKNSIDLIVSPVKMLVGDIYHFQDEKAGRYKILGRKGHYNIRAIRNFKGLKVEGVYPNEAYADENGKNIQNFNEERIIFAKNYYLHASHLKRSSIGNNKFKYDKGISFPLDYYYPEVFFKNAPINIDSIFIPQDFKYTFLSLFFYPLRFIKRRIV
jgi:glycosyltransferase involved in cell wall biosynthesis